MTSQAQLGNFATEAFDHHRGPTTTTTRRTESEGVVHLCYATDDRPIRLGANPSAPLVQLHRQATIHVLTAYGIPAEFVEAGDSTVKREAWRQFVFGSIAPLSRSIEAELTAKLETPITLNFSELRASDLASRSRTCKQLIEAGMTDQQASIISGFD